MNWFAKKVSKNTGSVWLPGSIDLSCLTRTVLEYEKESKNIKMFAKFEHCSVGNAKYNFSILGPRNHIHLGLF